VITAIANVFNRQLSTNRTQHNQPAQKRESVRCTKFVQLRVTIRVIRSTIMAIWARVLCRLINHGVITCCNHWITRALSGDMGAGMCSIVGNRAHPTAPTLSGPAVEVDGAAPSPPSNFVYGHPRVIFGFSHIIPLVTLIVNCVCGDIADLIEFMEDILRPIPESIPYRISSGTCPCASDRVLGRGEIAGSGI
jgi:hypothetical protein